jgi:pyrimidine operon attenuation protein / uracil phosphoribosyltransferase
MSGASVPAGGPAPPATILTDADVARVIDRMAHQIIESIAKSGFDAVLLGIPTRGVPLARAVAHQIAELGHEAPPVLALDPSAHRDDRPRPTAPQPALSGADGGGAIRIDGAVVIVVDDVLFTGRTVRAALDALVDCGRPAAVEILTLIDRGHRELPLRATYVGKNVPTASGDRVFVRMREVDGVDGAWLRRGAHA